MTFAVDPASFRDPNGFIYSSKNVIYRQINKSYRVHYYRLMKSGLYKELAERKLLVSHQEVSSKTIHNELDVYKTICPDQIPFISYPYEWCFSQLKDAALLTLAVAQKSLDFGMIIKDASAYNVQYVGNNPVFIDTLSFETYVPGKPWVAYRQFCQQFLSPLLLMSKKSCTLNKMLVAYPEGIPLDVTSSLLPFSSIFDLTAIFNIHIHAFAQKRISKQIEVRKKKLQSFSLKSLKGLLDNLESGIRHLFIKGNKSEWSEYYDHNSYTKVDMSHKEQLVSQMIASTNASQVLDIGTNTGKFSKLARSQVNSIIAIDSDYLSIEKLFTSLKKNNLGRILPLWIDITNPTPAVGWNSKERLSFIERGPFSTVLALAIIHHLTFTNSIPLPVTADFFRNIAKHLVIEFVPKSDAQVEVMFRFKEDIYPSYSQLNFEKEYSRFFHIKSKIKIGKSQRYLYLMHNKSLT